MTLSANIPQRFKRSPHSEPAKHLFAVGQAVRLKEGLLRPDNVYRITAMLPPIGDTLQYRIRSEAEQFERVATQHNLEDASPTVAGAGKAPVETGPWTTRLQPERARGS